MINAPMELKQKIRFCTPVRKISSLVVEPRQIPFFSGSLKEETGKKQNPRMIDDPIFRGSCETESDLYVPPIEAIVEMANCRGDEDAVKRFTRRYGVLVTAADGRFAFQLSDWRAMQRQFRCTWDGFLGLDSRYPSEIVPYFKEHAPHLFLNPLKGVEAAGRFELTSKGLDFVTDSLYAALVLVLIAVHERGSLRHCAKPGCDEPYFIAAHPRQRYCTEKCAAWAQAEAKSAWWKLKGKEWIEQQAGKQTSKAQSKKSTKKGGKVNGTHKAR
jgi:hypothetical protein